MVAPRIFFEAKQEAKIKRYTCTHAGSFPMWHHPSDSKTTLSIPGQARPGQPTGREQAEFLLAGLYCKDWFLCTGAYTVPCAGKHVFVYWAMYWTILPISKCIFLRECPRNRPRIDSKLGLGYRLASRSPNQVYYRACQGSSEQMPQVLRKLCKIRACDC